MLEQYDSTKVLSLNVKRGIIVTGKKVDATQQDMGGDKLASSLFNYVEPAVFYLSPHLVYGNIVLILMVARKSMNIQMEKVIHYEEGNFEGGSKNEEFIIIPQLKL